MGTPIDVLHSFLYADRTTQPARVPVSGNTRRWRRMALIGSVALVPTLSTAAPLVFEETAKIAAPDPTYEFAQQVAVEGDTIIATGWKLVGEFEHYSAYLFQRQSNGEWAYVRTLAQHSCNSGEVAEDTCTASVAIRNGVAVVSAGDVHVFERATDGTWTESASDGVSGPGDAAVGTGAVLTSESNSCAWSSSVFTKNSAGTWTLAATLPGASFSCDSWGMIGSDVSMSDGNRLIVGSVPFDDDVHIYEPNGMTWTQTATLTSPIGAAFGYVVAIDDTRAFVAGPQGTPIHVFSRNTGGWLHVGNIVPPDSAQHAGPAAIKVRDLVVAAFPNDPHRGGSVAVFQEISTGEYEQVARLVGSDSGSQQLFLGLDVDAYVDGSSARIVAASSDGVYVFDLDEWGTTPAPLQENFEQGNAANWTPMAGSSFSVVASGASQVYRQSSVAGDAGSFVTTIDWTDQAIEADVKPTAFDGSNRWVGLAVRRTDGNNYYYLTLRQSNVLEIKRMLNGSFVTLASTSMPVTLNRTYRLRLEAVGTLLRAYVDGRLAVEVHDSELTHGHAGVRMYKARADFDNVVLSQNPHLTLLENRTEFVVDRRWSLGPGDWDIVFVNNGSRLVQQDLSGDARAVSLVDANDQIVQVRASATAFASGTTSRWFGVMARYRDAGNYYYVTVRSDNTISLRKLVNGAIHVLDSAPLTVSTGTPYTLRLEAVGQALRVHVNGSVLLEANDASHASGRYGVVTYKAAATYDDFTAWEP